jgi:hypothetical protein
MNIYNVTFLFFFSSSSQLTDFLMAADDIYDTSITILWVLLNYLDTE